MKRRIATERLSKIYRARYTWLDESNWPQKWPINPITIVYLKIPSEKNLQENNGTITRCTGNEGKGVSHVNFVLWRVLAEEDSCFQALAPIEKTSSSFPIQIHNYCWTEPFGSVTYLEQKINDPNSNLIMHTL